VHRESLFESVPNFSEGRRPDVIAAIAAAAGPARVLDVDADADHHRVVLSMAARPADLVDALVASVGVAVDRIDIRTHSGVHPRVGAADVIPIVPLDGSALDEAAEIARATGERVWRELRVPVYFYGSRLTLADVRNGRARPDLGGPEPHPTAGAACIGARPPLVAFNVLLPGTDLEGARALARSLRESDGGLRGVQALAFQLSGGRVQLSMNLFRIDETTPARVVAELVRRRVRVGAQELVGLSPAVAAGAEASGRLLEGRLAAAAAAAGARRCHERGGEEGLAVSARLERESVELAALGTAQADLLAGAERAAALPPVLRAAGVLDGELDALARVAARGLHAAIAPATRAAYPARLAALESRL
jgi:glutamate formiminotransferase / 5-formyltetrahydrofolate cyclo-ligase